MSVSRLSWDTMEVVLPPGKARPKNDLAGRIGQGRHRIELKKSVQARRAGQKRLSWDVISF
jgi:hypothetical protein